MIMEPITGPTPWSFSSKLFSRFFPMELTFDGMKKIFDGVLVKFQSFFIILIFVLFCCFRHQVYGFLKMKENAAAQDGRPLGLYQKRA